MKSKLLLCLLFITPFAFGQVQNNMWCFGDHAGLNFNSGSPVPLASTSINTSEGCSSIADNAGNLLFYTDGIKAWNQNHIQMPNGFGMIGSSSTTQSGLIVPIPGSATTYYIFSIDALAGAMVYSKVDMTLAGGLGDVIAATKNTPLHPIVAEKQCAIQRCDGNIWVISHQYNSNNFFADLVTPAGINPSIVSAVGSINQGGGNPTWNSVGYMKASQQGNRLALAIRDASMFEVFDFDVNTGIVSNPLSITANHNSLYGVEFSPNGNILYGTSIISQQIYQFNLLAGNAAAISASSVTINTSAWGCALQLATDGKIYTAEPFAQVSGNPMMGVINSPNTLGAGCNYVSNVINLGANSCLLGLPNFMIRSTVTGNITITGTTSICAGQSTTLTASGGATYQWSGGSTATTAAITVSPAVTTSYYVQSGNGTCTVFDTAIVLVNPAPIAAITGNLNICAGQTTVLTANGATSYQWSGGNTDTTSIITVSPLVTTSYTVTPSNGNCIGTPVSVIVTVAPMPNGNIVASATSICTGQSVTLTASGGGTYQWSGGNSSTLSVINVSPVTTTTYYLQTSNGTCSDIDSIVIQVMGLTVVTGNTTICEGQTTTLTATGGTTYQWSGGSNATTASITVSPTTATTYYVTGTSACGSSTDSAIVIVNPGPVIDITNTYTQFYLGGNVQLNVTGGTSYIWTNGNGLSCTSCPNPIASPTVPITYIVTGMDANGCTGTDTVTINPISIEHELYIPNCITPNEDGKNDVFFAYGINIKTLTMRIFDRWGELIFESNDKKKGWDATYYDNYVELGVYVYTVHCEWLDGESKDLRGIVTVVY